MVEAAVAAVQGQTLDHRVDHLDAGGAGGGDQPGDVRHHPGLQVGDEGRVGAPDRIADLQVLHVDQQQRGSGRLDRHVSAQAFVGTRYRTR